VTGPFSSEVVLAAFVTAVRLTAGVAALGRGVDLILSAVVLRGVPEALAVSSAPSTFAVDGELTDSLFKALVEAALVTRVLAEAGLLAGLPDVDLARLARVRLGFALGAPSDGWSTVLSSVALAFLLASLAFTISAALRAAGDSVRPAGLLGFNALLALDTSALGASSTFD
jgi:hypothetical protein